MREKPLKKNSRFYLGMVLNVVEGMLSGFNFLLLYEAMKMLWNGTINSPSLLRLSLFLGGIFILRIVIYKVRSVVQRSATVPGYSWEIK